MTHVAPRIVNNVSGVKRINDECYFSWQAQYRCWRDISVAPRIVTNVSYVMRINHESHFPWQAQQSVIL